MNSKYFIRIFKGLKPDDNGCLTWPGKSGRRRDAYRQSFETFKGPIPSDRPFICHTCDNPKCVNPEHLWTGTNAENIQDARDKGRLKFQKIIDHSKGTKNSQSKLTESQVIEIRRLWTTGNYQQREIAVMFNVSQFPIMRITSGRGWKHLL